MDWNTLLVATVPAMVTGLIAYFSASSKAKTELDKAKLDQETALKKIESEKKTAIDTIERTAKNEIEKMRSQTIETIQLYKAKSQTDLDTSRDKMMLEEESKAISNYVIYNDKYKFIETMEKLKDIRDWFFSEKE